MKQEESNKITNLNFILTILIVFMHSSCLSYSSTIQNAFVGIIYNFIYGILNIAVPTFFALSTILFFRNFDMSKYKFKIKSRIKSLVLPYLFWSTVFLVYYIIITHIPWVSSMDTTMEPIKYNLFSILYYILFAKYAGALWYIRELFILFLISPIIYSLVIKLKSKNWILILFVITMNLIFKPSYYTFIYWLPLYYMFAYLVISKKKININLNFLKFLLISGGGVLLNNT